MNSKQNSEAGFSLVAVLIVMGVVLFSMLLISQAKFRAQGTQKAIKTKQSYSDINQALINNVVDVFHKELNGSCGNLVSTKLKNQTLDGAVKYTFASPIKAAPKDGTIPQIHKEARDRCGSPKNPGGGNRFYFCVQIEGDTSAPKDSILNSEYAFAEFAVELIDLQTQAPISCSEYASRRDDKSPSGTPRDGSAGMAVTMALYWANQTGAKKGSYTYSQKALSYIANQN